MKIHSSIILITSLFIGSLVGYLFGGGFICSIIARFLYLWVALPVVIVCLITFLVGKRWHHLKEFLGNFRLICFTCVLCIVGFAGVSLSIVPYREAKVRDFVEEVIPLLDLHKKEFGRYPHYLKEVTDRSPPYYLQGSGSYRTEGASFMFYYETPDSIMGGLMLTDAHRVWSVAD